MQTIFAPSRGLQSISTAQKESRLRVTCVGAGYVGALTAITMAVKNPTVHFVVCDINERLIEKWN